MFYFTIFKKSVKNKSVKLFLRGPLLHTFIKYLLTQDDRNNPVSQPSMTEPRTRKKLYCKLLVSGHSQGPGASQKEKVKAEVKNNYK